MNEILNKINNEHINANLYSPVTLAYLGDAVYEMFVRTKLVKENNMQVNKLQKLSIKYVKASAQAETYKKLEVYLTEEERKIAKRGKNAKVNTMAKNADPIDYMTATGFEALIGWLYLEGRMDRLGEIIDISLTVPGQKLMTR
ncbi:MAG TPA: ribonuclease III [Clostridiales bacterium]|nr:ribonuclease III [Clostridiales bacterium]